MSQPMVTKSARDRHPKSIEGRPPDPQIWSIIPILLLCLSLLTSPAFAQSSSTSSSQSGPTALYNIATIPALINLPALNSSRPAIELSFPPTPNLFLTFNLCSLTSNSSFLPTILISTSTSPAWSLGSRSTSDLGSGGTQEGGYNRRSRSGGLWSLTWDKGFGNWTVEGLGQGESVKVLLALNIDTDGASRIVSGTGNIAVQLGISSLNPLHRLSSYSPLLGDTTNSTALIFSPILHHLPQTQPTYPNYTLPPAQIPFTSIPTTMNQTNLTLILVPTGSSPTEDGLDNSLCAVRAANISTGGIASARNAVLNRTEPSWMRIGGEEGFRVAWGAGDLVAGGSNYTAWILDEAKGELSRPIWLATKEAGFACPLILPTSFCPSIAYAAPVPANATNPTHPLSALPENITSLLTSNLDAISTSLLSTACGRDRYSYTSSCADCYAAYRDWLCRVLIPRCGTGISTSSTPQPRTIRRSLVSPRIPGIPLGPEAGYDELLPCLSTCNAVDRACPVNLNFRCPLRKYGAERSYGFVGDEPVYGDGSDDLGVPASDRWGNVWCNG